MTLLSAPIPLRSTTLWGGYRKSEPIPYRYGSVTGRLLQYNAERTLFVWADHAVGNISAVEIAGQPAPEWDWENRLDSTGRAVAMVRFGQPVDDGVEPVATGTGKLHPVTGALITNPATVVWDILANIAGQPIAETVVNEFRDACAALSVEVSGTVEGDANTQSILVGLCSSVGAIFSVDMPGLCMIWPGGTLAPSKATLATGPIAPETRLDDLANDLSIEFDHADGSARQSLQVESVDSIARYGRRSATHSAPWISSPRVAFDVAARILRTRARPQWRVTASMTDDLRIGDAVTLAHSGLPIAGSYPVLERTGYLDSGTAEIILRVPYGSEPVAKLVRTSTAFTPGQYAGVSIAPLGPDFVLKLTEDDGRPMAGAAVTLDGQIKRYSDTGGRVVFPNTLMPPGEHQLDILTLDGRSLTTVVTV